jgi:hypothetical protein
LLPELTDEEADQEEKPRLGGDREERGENRAGLGNAEHRRFPPRAQPGFEMITRARRTQTLGGTLTVTLDRSMRPRFFPA